MTLINWALGNMKTVTKIREENQEEETVIQKIQDDEKGKVVHNYIYTYCTYLVHKRNEGRRESQISGGIK